MSETKRQTNESVGLILDESDQTAANIHPIALHGHICNRYENNLIFCKKRILLFTSVSKHTQVVPVDTPLPIAAFNPLPLNPVAVPKIHPMIHGPMNPLTVAPITCAPCSQTHHITHDHHAAQTCCSSAAVEIHRPCATRRCCTWEVVTARGM